MAVFFHPASNERRDAQSLLSRLAQHDHPDLRHPRRPRSAMQLRRSFEASIAAATARPIASPICSGQHVSPQGSSG